MNLRAGENTDPGLDALHNALEDSKVERSEKVAAFRRLARFGKVKGS